MKTTNEPSELDEVPSLLKGLADEARVQAHLGLMELQAAEPYLAEVAQTSRAVVGDLVKRGRALKVQLAQLRAGRVQR